VKVFAVEDTTAQVMWARRPRGGVLRAGDAAADVGPEAGAVVLDGLPPDTRLDLVLEPEGEPARRVGRFRTLAPPPGRELARVATVNDCHLGGHGFGVLPSARHPEGGFRLDTHDRCLEAAVAEAVAWGAQVLVVKGDLTEGGRTWQWRTAARILGQAGVPVLAVPGNHDVMRGSTDGRPILAPAGIRLTVGDAEAYDLPGLRVITVDSSRPLHHPGSVDGVTPRVLALAAEAPAGVLVALHHQFEPFDVRTHWPPGISRAEGNAFLDALAAANPAVLVTTGHTHRHRRRQRGPVVLTEVGSNKDYPGTWTGFVVHEGGIRQVVRRVADPSSLRWTDATRYSFLGLWGAWSTGTLDARCFSHRWPDRPAA
jgi:predicted phosphodiesterase